MVKMMTGTVDPKEAATKIIQMAIAINMLDMTAMMIKIIDTAGPTTMTTAIVVKEEEDFIEVATIEEVVVVLGVDVEVDTVEVTAEGINRFSTMEIENMQLEYGMQY